MTIEAARDWKQPTLSATKKSHPLGNIGFRDLFPQFPWKQRWWAVFSEKFLQSHGTYEDDSSSQLLEYRQLVIQQNIHFDLALEDLRQNGWCLWWIRSKEMMHISYTRYHCFYVYMVDFLTLKLNLYSPTHLFFVFSPFSFLLSSLCFFLYFPLSPFPILQSISPTFSV